MALITGITSYFKMDGSSADSAGANTGTDTAISYVSGKINQGGSLNGTTSQISVPFATLNNMNTGTIAMWVNPASVAGAYFTSKQHDGVSTYAAFSVGRYISSGGADTAGISGKLYWHGRNGTTQAVSTASISTGSFQHIVITFSATSCTFYINGSADATTSGDYSIPNDTAPTNTLLGRWFTPGGPASQVYSGAMDEVGIWSRELTSGEVTQLYNAGAGTQYPFGTTYTFTAAAGSYPYAGYPSFLTVVSGKWMNIAKSANSSFLNASKSVSSWINALKS